MDGALSTVKNIINILSVEGVGNIIVTVIERQIKIWDIEFGAKKFESNFTEQ